MPRGPGFPPEIVAHAVNEYLAGRATMPTLAKTLGVTTATISRWVAKARARGVTAPAPAPIAFAPIPEDGRIFKSDLPTRVAELAPPPAPPPPPAVDMSDGTPETMIAGMAEIQRRQLEEAARARAMNDPRTANQALTAAANTAREIRQLRNALREEGGDALAITRDDVDAAMLEIRRRLDEIAAAKGETLMWTLDGTPDVSVAPTSPDTSGVTPERNSDALVTPPGPLRRA